MTIHIGGTNGKGSVAALVYRTLRAAGHSVALYTSPHLVSIRERMIVNDRPMTEQAFTAWTVALRDTVEGTGASFFEATTAIAFADFAARGAAVAVVEVGLGGRLDATNVLDPLVSCVTHVRREHTDYLGESLTDIAREKAGIAKPGVPFVIGEEDEQSRAVLLGHAERVGACPVVVPAGSRYEEPLALRGDHQRRNAAVALAVLDELPASFRPDVQTVRRSFAAATLPGRLDLRGKWIFDVAHNLPGIEALSRFLDTTPPPRPLHALVGILRDKDWQGMLETLATTCDRLWVTQPPSAPPERRWDLRQVASNVRPPTSIEPVFEDALARVQHGAATVLVTGSFHTVGDAMARLPGFAPLG